MSSKTLTAIFLIQLAFAYGCDQDMRRIFNTIDFDADGFLNQEEFCSPENGMEHYEHCPEAYKEADLNQVNYRSRSDQF